MTRGADHKSGHLYGEQMYNAVLDDAKVESMRVRYAAGSATLRELAEENRIGTSHARLIVRGLLWKNAPGPITKARQRQTKRLVSGRSPGSHLSDAQVIEIRERYAAGGVTYRELAREYKVSETTIYNIIWGKKYRHLLQEED